MPRRSPANERENVKYKKRNHDKLRVCSRHSTLSAMTPSSFEEDLLELTPFAERLEKFIAVETDFVPESLVLSLNGNFGSGKSTFLRMWSHRLKEKKQAGEEVPKVIRVNAWIDDYCGDPLISLVSALVDGLETGETDTPIKNAAKDIAWFSVNMAAQVAGKVFADPAKAAEFTERKQAAREGAKEKVTESFFEAFRNRRTAVAELKEAIRSHLNPDGAPLLILLDELDRCRPDYAISYLETIKHVFDLKGVVFILAVDRKQMECSAKAAFGGDLDFNEYYRKFVHREAPLPEVNEASAVRFANDCIRQYLEISGKRHCFLKMQPGHLNTIKLLIIKMKLRPRQIQAAFRMLGHLLAVEQSLKGSLYWGFGTCAMLMCCFKAGREEMFEKLKVGHLTPKEAGEFSRSTNDKSPSWWFDLILCAGGVQLSESLEDRFTKVYTDAGFQVHTNEIGLKENIGSLGKSAFDAWMFTESRFHDIGNKIDQIDSWT